MKMRRVVAEIKRNGVMSGYQVSNLTRFVYGFAWKSAGGILSQALRRGLITIVGKTYVNGIEYNLYS
jgi:hypothetical protein